MTATVEDLEADKGRLEAEVQAVRSKVQSELDEVEFRVGVQAKAIAGLEGFKRKLESDLVNPQSSTLIPAPQTLHLKAC